MVNVIFGIGAFLLLFLDKPLVMCSSINFDLSFKHQQKSLGHEGSKKQRPKYCLGI